MQGCPLDVNGQCATRPALLSEGSAPQPFHADFGVLAKINQELARK